MEPAKAYFDAIVKQYLLRYHQVKTGLWRGEEALLYEDQAFVVYQPEGMLFCLGKNRSTADEWLLNRTGIKDTEPVYRDWFLVDYTYKDMWAPLTEAALWFVKRNLYKF